MQLFTRRVSMTGPPDEIIGYATDMASFVSDRLGRELALWLPTMGAPVGTLFYTARVEGIADLAGLTSTLMGDSEYMDKLRGGMHLVAAPAMDSLATPLYGELGDPPPVGSYAGITSAVIANGQYRAALAWGVEMAQHVESVTGNRGMFLSNRYGEFGGVTWISGAADAAAADAARAAVDADDSYLDRLNDVGTLFLPGSGQQGLVNRIA